MNLDSPKSFALKLHRIYTPSQEIVAKLNEEFESTFYMSHGCIFRINPTSPIADLIFNPNEKEIY